MSVRRWGSERIVGTTDVQVESKDADVAGLADGGYVVVWEDDSTTQRVLAQRFDALGNPVGAEIVVDSNDIAGTAYSQPQVTGLLNGGFAVTFTSSAGGGNVWAITYAADGSLVVGFSDPASDSDGAITTDGADYRYVRQSNGDIRIGVSTVNDDATAGVQEAPVIAEIAGGDRYVVTWLDLNGGNNVRYRVFGDNGTAVTASTQANTSPGVAELHAPSVIGLADGRFVIAWGEGSTALQDRDGYSVHAKIYTADGTQEGGEFVVNATFKDNQAFPDIVALPDGGFVAVWSDSSAGSGDFDYNIVGQRFDAFGARVGGQFTVNTETDGMAGQYLPHIAALADGRLVVEWHSAATGEIRTQIIDPRDGLVSGTEAANTLYGHDVGGDEIGGFGGNDILAGLGGDDSLYGGGGADELRGGAGADHLDGGSGIDTASYATSSEGVVVRLDLGLIQRGEAEGDVLTGIENLSGSQYDDSLGGDAGANMLQGGNGNDGLNGGDGGDLLYGGDGNDSLNGGDGADVFYGGAGADILRGSNGIDTASYFTSSSGVVVNLYFGTASGGEAQGDNLGFDIENLSGSQGNDNLVGNGGINVLQGWNGNDALTGGREADILTGGAGADRFVYLDVVQSLTGAGADRITDFSRAQGDKIDLWAIDADTAVAGNQAFSFIGTALYSGVAGQLRYAVAGGVTTIAGDINGDSVSDFHIQLTGAIALAAGDFAL
jgi:Ca2+-binding RTX toxin-like protein